MKRVLGIIYFVYGLLFSAYIWFLTKPQEGFNYSEFVLLLGFISLLFINISLNKVNRQKVFVAGSVFLVSFVWGYFSGIPTYRSVEDTLILNNIESKAAEKGISYAENVLDGEFSEKQAEEIIENDAKLTPSLKRVSKKALELALKKEMDNDAIVSESSNIVPVGVDNWDCNQNGCGYSDNYNVWTISIVDRYASLSIMLIAHIFLSFLVFDKFYHLSISRVFSYIPFEVVEIRK